MAIPLVAALACGLATPTGTTATTSRYEAVARGAVYEARSWLSADLTSRLRADGASLLAGGAFRSSGLSNTARGEQGAQGFGANDRSVLAITPELGGDVSARAELQLLIDQLRLELSAELQRPGLVLTLTLTLNPTLTLTLTLTLNLTLTLTLTPTRCAPSSTTP